MVHPPELSSTSHPRLNLIGDQQCAVTGAKLASPGQVIIRWHHRARLALHRLDHECGYPGTHGLSFGEFRLKRIRIPIRRETHIL